MNITRDKKYGYSTSTQNHGPIAGVINNREQSLVIIRLHGPGKRARNLDPHSPFKKVRMESTVFYQKANKGVNRTHAHLNRRGL